MSNTPFAGYHKEVVTVVERIQHRVRVRLGSSAADLMDYLKHVPKHATISEVVGDTDHEDFEACGEIVFTEERDY